MSLSDSLYQAAAFGDTLYHATRHDRYDQLMLLGTWVGVLVSPIVAVFASVYGAKKGAQEGAALTEKIMLAAREQELAGDRKRRQEERDAEIQERRYRVKRKAEYVLTSIRNGAVAITKVNDTDPMSIERLLAIREACTSSLTLLEDLYLILSAVDEAEVRSVIADAAALTEAPISNEQFLIDLDSKWRAGHASPNSVNEAVVRRQGQWKRFMDLGGAASARLDAIEHLYAVHVRKVE